MPGLQLVQYLNTICGPNPTLSYLRQYSTYNCLQLDSRSVQYLYLQPRPAAPYAQYCGSTALLQLNLYGYDPGSALAVYSPAAAHNCHYCARFPGLNKGLLSGIRGSSMPDYVFLARPGRPLKGTHKRR